LPEALSPIAKLTKYSPPKSKRQSHRDNFFDGDETDVERVPKTLGAVLAIIERA
jgi:hypothetical protein